MTPRGKVRILRKATTNDADEAAADKLWAVYVHGAEKYDRALVESWKSDMDGLLIFAALFSAIVTAFVIESYKTLKSDSGEQTVRLLVQISHQLAASANGSIVQVPSSAPAFHPSTQATLCNVFWLISLSLSLACALLTTFVQQWAHKFQHRASMRPAPAMRARIFSYMYFGLKRFHMQMVVDIIPLLLHVSLLLFLAGLVVFLMPVHNLMVAIAAGILFVFTAVYGILTILPLWSSDCPYHTPLSGTFWGILQAFKHVWYQSWPGDQVGDVTNKYPHNVGLEEFPDHQSFSSDTYETMVDAMSRTALKASPERDQKALVWTMKSLSDNVELQAFVDAIPDLLWGPHQRRHGYEDHIQYLVNHPETQLHRRVAALLDSCNTDLLSPKDNHHRRVTCYKALWAIASLAEPIEHKPGNYRITSFSQESLSNYNTAVDFSTISRHLFHESTYSELDPVTPYSLSASTIMEWSTFHGIKGQLLQLRHNLDLYASKTTGSSMPDLRHTWLFIRAKHSLLRMDPIVSIYPESGSDEIAQLRHHIDALLPFPSLILSRYFASSAGLPSLPYRWNETWSMISADLDSSVFPQEFESCLDHLVNVAMATLNIAKVGTIISALLSLWQPTDDTTPIPSAMIDFFNQWDQGLALGNVLRAGGKIEAYLWAHFPPTLLNSCSGWNAELKPNVLTALWRLAALPGRPNVAPAAYLISLHCTQKALAETLNRFPNKHLSQITTSIVLLLKSRIASAQFVSDNGTIGDGLACFKDSIFPMESAIMIPDQVLSANAEERISAAYWLALYECMACRKDEAQIVSLAEFLEQCNSDELPYEAVETVKNIAMEPNKGSVHPKHQIRLANSVQANFVAHGVTGILNAVINCRCWNLYAEEPNGRLGVAQFDSRWPWLDNPAAHRKIRETFAAYAEKFSVSTDLPDILTRLQNILQGLGSWHPEAEATAGCTVFNPM